MDFQVRAILGLLTAGSLLALRKATRRLGGRSVANWFAILQTSQFHVMYYASRTLPNTFAFALSKLTTVG